MNREIKETIDYLKAHEDNLAFRINELLKYLDELQKENEYSNYCNEELRKKITNLKYKIELLEQENEELKGSGVNE